MATSPSRVAKVPSIVSSTTATKDVSHDKSAVAFVRKLDYLPVRELLWLVLTDHYLSLASNYSMPMDWAYSFSPLIDLNWCLL